MDRLNLLTKYFFVEAFLQIEEHDLILTDYLKAIKNTFNDGLIIFKEIKNNFISKCSFIIKDIISLTNREINLNKKELSKSIKINNLDYCNKNNHNEEKEF